MGTSGPPRTVLPDTATRRRLPIGALLLGALIGYLLLSLFGHTVHADMWDQVARVLTGRSTHIDTSSPTVVEKIRQLSRLETVEYTVEKIVEGDRQNPYLPNFLVGDQLMLVAHGEVVAGVDLSQLKSSDVAANGDTVTVKLPKAQILTTRLDSGQTRVYSRTTGLLVNADPNLESQVRQAAEQQIAQAALADGVLDKAHQNARASVTALLNGLGFHHVQVD